MKRIYFLAPLLTVFVAHCPAASVTVDGTGERILRGAISGTPVPAGSDILVGYFSGLTNAEIVSNQHNPTLLNSSFIRFGLGGSVGEGALGTPGYFTFVTTATVEAPNAAFTAPSAPNNGQIYIWVFNSGVSPEAATEHAIFTSTASAWSWPVSDDGSTDRMISPDDNLSMLVGSLDSGAVYLQAMPEPGSCALVVMGTVGLLGMRPANRRLGRSKSEKA